MNAGNELDHLVREAIERGHTETAWLMLRNVFFRDGAPEDAWDAMSAWFATRSVKATSEWRTVNGSQVRFVRLTRQV